MTPLHPLRPVLPELFDAGGEPTRRLVVTALRDRWGDGDPVLVVEDLDAADPATLDLVDALPDHLATGLLVVTSRALAPVEIGR